MPDRAVRNNAELSRFELEADGGVAFVNYRLSPGTITLVHTEVPAQFRGRGIASALARGVLEDVRKQGLKVVVRCPFLQEFITRNPEFNDLVR